MRVEPKEGCLERLHLPQLARPRNFVTDTVETSRVSDGPRNALKSRQTWVCPSVQAAEPIIPGRWCPR